MAIKISKLEEVLEAVVAVATETEKTFAETIVEIEAATFEAATFEATTFNAATIEAVGEATEEKTIGSEDSETSIDRTTIETDSTVRRNSVKKRTK